MKRVSLPLMGVLLGILLSFTVAGQTSGFKVRALWVDPTGFVSAEAVDKMISKCERAGINTIIPNVMYRNDVYYKSKNFKGNVVANDQFDPLGYMISKAHAVGIKVQAWSCVYYISAQKKEWIGQIIDPNASDRTFLTPAHPEVNPYILSVIKEMLNYDVDGIHLDYCRYWNAAYDYSDAARKGCQEQLGFDPINFLDHPEKIVPADKDVFPIRVLHPKTQIGKAIELGHTERNMNMTGVGYAFVSESPKNIDALKTPGLLIIDYYTDVSRDMVAALERYVKRGGNILWMNQSNEVLASYPELQKLTGLSGAKSLRGRVSLGKAGNHAISSFIPAFQFNTSGNILEVSDATVLAKLSTGEPVITVKKNGKSNVMVIGFNAMECSRDSIVGLMRGIMNWYRETNGVASSKDLLAEKRNQWIKWREDQIVPLVRDISKAVKEKNPNLVLTSSAGVGPQQTHGIYREGGYWLTENINDYLFPMNYAFNPVDLVDILEEQKCHTPKGTADRIYPGIKLYKWQGKDAVPNDADIIEKQLLLVQKDKYPGFCLFCARDLSEEIIEVVKKFSR